MIASMNEIINKTINKSINLQDQRSKLHIKK